MANVQRRGLQLQRNEENLVAKTGKTLTRQTGGRTVLSNIANIQRRPTLNNKAKGEKPIHKAVGRVKAESAFLPKQQNNVIKKEAFIIHQEEDCRLDEVSDDDDDVHLDELNADVEDIDEEDIENPTLCAEYVKDIYKYMHKLEKRLRPGDYISRQTEINKKMRSILIDWLIQVQSRFNLLQETLYLTVYTIDRFLDKQDVRKSQFQLVGVTAMLLASKYEEMYAPEIGDFVYITDNAYSKDKIRTMEQKMMKACDYDFSNPLCLHFLRRNSKAGSVDAQKHTLAKYLMELTLIDYDLARRLPSEIAAAALYLSIKLIDQSDWTTTLQHYSGYSEKTLAPIVAQMAGLVLSMDSSKYQAVKTKYSASKFLKISRLPVLKNEMIRHFAEKCEREF